jgi:hypothetical protein
VGTVSQVQTPSTRSTDQRSLVVVGVFLGLLAVAVQTALYLADVYALDRRVGTFDVDSERGISAWAATVAIFSTGFVALLLSVVESSRRLRLLALAGAVTFLSFDESLIVHERLGLAVTEALDLSDKYLRVAWPAIYLPLLAAVAALIFQLAWTSPNPARRLLAIGLITLGGAVGLEIAGLALDLIPSLPDELYTAEIALEEAAELAGWILLTTGLAVLLLDKCATQVTPNPQPE